MQPPGAHLSPATQATPVGGAGEGRAVIGGGELGVAAGRERVKFWGKEGEVWVAGVKELGWKSCCEGEVSEAHRSEFASSDK